MKQAIVRIKRLGSIDVIKKIMPVSLEIGQIPSVGQIYSLVDTNKKHTMMTNECSRVLALGAPAMQLSVILDSRHLSKSDKKFAL